MEKTCICFTTLNSQCSFVDFVVFRFEFAWKLDNLSSFFNCWNFVSETQNSIFYTQIITQRKNKRKTSMKRNHNSLLMKSEKTCYRLKPFVHWNCTHGWIIKDERLSVLPFWYNLNHVGFKAECNKCWFQFWYLSFNWKGHKIHTPTVSKSNGNHKQFLCFLMNSKMNTIEIGRDFLFSDSLCGHHGGVWNIWA